MSKFIEDSKHPEMTAAITHVFFGGEAKAAPGVASGKQYDRGGTDAWNTSPVSMEPGLPNSAPSGAPSGPSMFNDNIAKPMLPRETGVNYKPRANAGHTMTAKPFQGPADGLPGNSKLLWD